MVVVDIIFAVVAAVILFWQISLLIAAYSGTPVVYSRDPTIAKAFEGATLKRGQLVADLGCGNARSLIIAAKKFDARGIGVEISPFYYFLAKLNVLFSGESQNVKIYFGNFRKMESKLKDVDVIFLYLFNEVVQDIEPWIFNTIKRGTRIISLAFPFQNHQAMVIQNKPPIYIYK